MQEVQKLHEDRLSAIVDKGDAIEINSALCVGCKLCSNVCAFNAIEKAGDKNE